MIRPAADVDVTAGLVRTLLREQHPDLADLPLEPVASGWDNVVFRLGADLAVRLPRRAAAAALIRNEQRWLPALAARLPVPVPVPVRVGNPGAGYPWSWTVVPWLAGEPAAAVRAVGGAGPEAEPEADLAADLADVVVALHVAAPAGAPVNPVRGVALDTRHDAVIRRIGDGVLDGLDPGGFGPCSFDPYRVLALWDRLRAVPRWQGPAIWLHGDLHPANLLLRGTRLSAVLDFGDLTAGDPATDLAAAWLCFDAPGRAVFVERVTARCGSDAATWERARGWALNMATAMLAARDDDPVLAAVGRRALGQVCAA